ncbi:lipopolysaccharide transport periplasmic protein LptA [Methylophaga nitratireducenticrescens]|uniref:Lipopolysaccharide export system protein LptA n=1 Tax=Methylophaga nitratireducenticrescens TaxID=754476 RepID=I1XGW1_METNJ|nr:lipopolysaccharide transport periplasmic protein LptA [Methylophaga nitratireducenticrescens]AFI83630.1 lipopolysaccharide transport periplasmic protein LptA [Methylophaga nitratireducenticrescens]AUZ83731.1 lipopolysaccharide transport periplasmic protein LptA [Methylophaga nitratireducenticrescens]
MRHLLINLLWGITIIPSIALALPSDREQPINIEADHAQLDDETGVTQYKGDAILTQGTLRIEGDVITFFYDENRELEKAIAEGNLATYEQVHKEGDKPVKAKALQMEYHASKQRIFLVGQGYVWQSGDEFRGNHIEYDIDRNIVIANSRPVEVDGQQQSSGRVHITIQPPEQREKKNRTSAKPEVETPPPSTEAPEQQSDLSYPTAVTQTTLNVRTGPGTQYERLGAFVENTEVIVLTRQPEWVQVRGMIGDKAIIGWVSARYLKMNPE